MLLDLNKKEHLDALKEVVLWARQYRDPPKPNSDAVSRLAAAAQPTAFEQAIQCLKLAAVYFPADASTDDDHREMHTWFHGGCP